MKLFHSSNPITKLQHLREYFNVKIIIFDLIPHPTSHIRHESSFRKTHRFTNHLAEQNFTTQCFSWALGCGASSFCPAINRKNRISKVESNQSKQLFGGWWNCPLDEVFWLRRYGQTFTETVAKLLKYVSLVLAIFRYLFCVLQLHSNFRDKNLAVFLFASFLSCCNCWLLPCSIQSSK